MILKFVNSNKINENWKDVINELSNNNTNWTLIKNKSKFKL